MRNLMVLFLLCASTFATTQLAFAQASQEARQEEAIARARVIAADRMVPVTAKQCRADLESWVAKDEGDVKEKVDAPNYWYQRLASEELHRMASEGLSCRKLLPSKDWAQLTSYQAMFLYELLCRARAVLARHALVKEYSLERNGGEQ